jgi:hypothetical protein
MFSRSISSPYIHDGSCHVSFNWRIVYEHTTL